MRFYPNVAKEGEKHSQRTMRIEMNKKVVELEQSKQNKSRRRGRPKRSPTESSAESVEKKH
jgi:hypothetical protein